MNVFAVFEHPDGGKILSSLPPGGTLCRDTTASCEGRSESYCVSILFHSMMMYDEGNTFSSAPGTLTIDLYLPGHPIVHLLRYQRRAPNADSIAFVQPRGL